jgi:hypothetical protein
MQRAIDHLERRSTGGRDSPDGGSADRPREPASDEKFRIIRRFRCIAISGLRQQNASGKFHSCGPVPESGAALAGTRNERDHAETS